MSLHRIRGSRPSLHRPRPLRGKRRRKALSQRGLGERRVKKMKRKRHQSLGRNELCIAYTIYCLS